MKIKKIKIKLKVNGKTYKLKIDSNKTLLEVLREELGLIGTKEGCGEGECGACSVILNGKLIDSCLMMAISADRSEILTIEGLKKGKKLHPLQKAFIEEGAVQCGFCIPGMILASKALLDKNSEPTEEEIKQGLDGNLCRCTGYDKIFKAVQKAGKEIKK